jgi:hypothetical protein
VKLTDFAPRFACMLPALFTCMPFAKSPRFAGDPWATFPHSPTWHWMHASTCALGSGAYAGACTSRRMRFETPLDDSQQVLKAEAARPDATGRECVLYRSPVGGPMGARQPAAAGPSAQCDLFAEVPA